MGTQTDADFEPRRYRVRHRTTYSYAADVTGCYERGCLHPRETPSQQVRSNTIEVSPEPDLMTEHVDHFGNHSHYVEVRTPHTELAVTKTSVVDVAWPRTDLDELDRHTVAEAVELLAGEADPVERVSYLLPSALVDLSPEVRAYAARLLPGDRPLGEAVLDLTRTIFAEFRYAKGATSVKTTLPELLEKREGVCQDFAHLAVGCLRAVGLPARYVSGYLETQPPPGRPKLAGSDASHAWASVLVPGGTWVDLDPTNDHLADSRYVVTAWGRDFRDVSPLKGVIFTESPSSRLEVAVDVTRLEQGD
ncbi:transglutaminase family protein [Luteipulveratus flavus]|uniref:Transglutaminase family protein n=1 Tax=Luteipulveratus flavus TaxID=3031728 RepID=A0ABT6C9C9_9MICO|nr:transglutaminase family protein [Luteipulveratus sp. YIM 133296]MDF8265519.1 transglutaminase family protein [Luteipulveratus sp. YIM 133296]